MESNKKKTKREATMEAEASSYSCVSSSPCIFPNAKTVLIVPTKDAKRIADALQEAKESLYGNWTIDDTTMESIDNLPRVFGHVVASAVPKELPKKEYEILQLLIDGKVSSTKYLIVEVRNGKEDYNEEAEWFAFSCDNEDLLREMKAALDDFMKTGESRYVGECEIVGSPSDPSLQKCGMRKLSKEDIQLAKDTSGDDTVTKHEYLRDL
jgi:hypothetical protein